MKILKYVASALALTAMAFSFSGCSNDNDEVDAKSNYLFEFVVSPGGLTEAQLQELNDSIDSKIYGSVGATHYPLYSTQEYALKNYDIAASDDSLFINGIVNPIADKYNVLDFTVTMCVKDANGTVLRNSKVYVPTVQRANYKLSVNVAKGTLDDANAEALRADIENLFAGNTVMNCTKGYAQNTYLVEKAAEIQTLSDNLADANSNDSFVPTLVVEGPDQQAAMSKNFAPRYDYVKQYVVVDRGSLSDEGVAELESDLEGVVFDGVATVAIHNTKAAASQDFDLTIIRKNVAIQNNVVNAVASKYNVDNFVVEVQLVNREGNIVTVDGTEKKQKYEPSIVRDQYAIEYEITQGSLTAAGFAALNTKILTDVFGGADSKAIGEATEGYATVEFTTFNTSNSAAIIAALAAVASTENVTVKDCKVTIKLVKTVDGVKETVTSTDYTL